VALVVALVLCLGATLVSPGAGAQLSQNTQALDGRGNNQNNPDWGRAGTPYTRFAPARYADGKSQPVAGPNTRLVSNRIFNDVNQNIFSENGISQWGNVWGQFLDHTFGLRDEAGTVANIPFNQADPLESFTNTLGNIPFTRSAASPGTGVTNTRQQTNTVSSYIDAWAVYGGTDQRLDFLREGSQDGNPNNNGARLFLPNNYLPRRDSRGNPAGAPTMAVDGRLLGTPNAARVAGDVRANENIALTATHTLFAREHNRIVNSLPIILSQDTKFAIARRVVIATQQWITYTEFLPTLGINLPAYNGYKPNVNANLTNEFATVGYRGHSMIHGEIEVAADQARYSQATLDAIEAQGVEIEPGEVAGTITFVIPLNVAFFNPELLQQIQLGPMLRGIGSEREYRNDEMIDNQLRSVLFQVPVSGNPECLDGPTLPECFRGVLDLGAIDIERGRDHGMPTYNQLRAALGLPAKSSFTAITGEATENFPFFDPELTRGNEINDPDSLDFVLLKDRNGNVLQAGTEEGDEETVTAVRRTTTAARLKAIYGSVNNLDAFTGMVAEQHIAGTEFGETQRALWTKQFQALRDGDRFFFGNDPTLTNIRIVYGIDFRHDLGDVIALNTEVKRGDLEDNVFLAPLD
jgi:hypothetical protein